MEKHKIDLLDKRILKYDNIDSDANLYLKLNANMLVYFNGTNFIAVPFSVFRRYLVIWDKYVKYDDSKIVDSFDVSIVMCPFTLASCVYEGKLYPSEFTQNGLMLYKTIDDVQVNILNKDNAGRRFSVKIGNYRSIMSLYPDCKILSAITDDESITYHTNLSKNLLNEQLVYLIQYKSENGDNKSTVIVGKSNNSFNLIESGIDKYFEEFEQQIIKKDSFIIPMLLSAVSKLLKNDYKVINL